MEDHIEHAARQASEAKDKAAASADSNARAEWLKLAHLWEELIREYGELEKFRRA
jgi:hypothetical protein